MTTKLKHIAAVQMGYSFRSRIETSDNGGTAVIQMKDLQHDNTVSCNDLVRIELGEVKKHHIARVGDLVFRSRGLLTTSAILQEDPGDAVVSAPLLRIRVHAPDSVLPAYLNWYISQRDAQAFLARQARGSVQKMISKQVIEDLDVTLPPIEIQKSIVELAALSEREQTLLRLLADKRQQQVCEILLQAAKEERI